MRRRRTGGSSARLAPERGRKPAPQHAGQEVPPVGLSIVDHHGPRREEKRTLLGEECDGLRGETRAPQLVDSGVVLVPLPDRDAACPAGQGVRPAVSAESLISTTAVPPSATVTVVRPPS